MNDELMKEVDDAVRMQRLQQMWQAFGKHLVMLIAVAVIASIAMIIWQQQENDKRQVQSDQLLQASMWLQQNTPEGKFKARELLEGMDLEGAHEQIRSLWLASIYLQTNQEAQAGELLKQANPDGADAELLKEYSCLLNPQHNETETPCIADIGFEALQSEFDAFQLLSRGEVVQAQARLPVKGSDVMQDRRLQDIRTYLSSSIEMPDIPAEEAAPGTPAETDEAPSDALPAQ